MQIASGRSWRRAHAHSEERRSSKALRLNAWVRGSRVAEIVESFLELVVDLVALRVAQDGVRPDADGVPLLQGDRVADQGVVDARAVLRAEIDDDVPSALGLDARMPARHAFVLDAHPGVVGASDDHGLAGQPEHSTQRAAGDRRQRGDLLLRRRARLGRRELRDRKLRGAILGVQRGYGGAALVRHEPQHRPVYAKAPRRASPTVAAASLLDLLAASAEMKPW